MDFVYLVESGKYKRKKLREEQEKFIAGMEYVKDELLDCMAADDDFAQEEDTPMLEKMIAEIRLDALKEIKERIYIDMCEFIVSMLDENACVAAYVAEGDKREDAKE